MALRSDSSQNLSHLLAKIQSSIDPDITIRCSGREFRIHSLILEDVSEFFDRVCNGPFKETRTGEIDLVEDNPDAVEAFVKALYEGDYGQALTNANLITRWKYHVNVYYFSIKYDIQDLAKRASDKLSKEMQMPHLEYTQGGAVQDLIDFVYSFKTLDRSLDDIKCILCDLFFSQLLHQSEDQVIEIMGQYPDFAGHLVLFWRDWRSHNRSVSCPSCIAGRIGQCLACMSYGRSLVENTSLAMELPAFPGSGES